MTIRTGARAVPLVAFWALLLAGCSDSAEPTSGNGASVVEDLAGVSGEAALAGVQFDVRRDPG